MTKSVFYSILVFSCLATFLSCSGDKTDDIDPIVIDPDDFVTDINNPETILESDLGTVEYFKGTHVDDSYILINDAGANRVYVMNKKAEILHEWDFTSKDLGNDVFLLSDGRLLAMVESEEPMIKLGGQAGVVQFIEKNGTTGWSYEYSSEDYISHHDAELLPNGNVIFQTWERKTEEEANEAGSGMSIDVFPDAILEVDPATDEIVWEWHSWDHLVQDHAEDKANYGVVADNPELINLNYIPDEKGDIMHANGISYDAENDLIYLSINFFSEIWVIDHSTTTQEAASHSGGIQNKGGDLVYRFGNPEAYNNSQGTRLFDHNHYPNLLSGEDKGKILVFSNGFSIGQSTAYELELPNPLSLNANTDNEPKVTWSFTHEELFSPKVSSVVNLSNGNKLITEGDTGLWEVTEKGQVVWRFKGEGFFWRGYGFDRNSNEMKLLGL